MISSGHMPSDRSASACGHWPGVGDWGLRIVSNNCVESESGPGFCEAVRCGGNILSDGV